LFTTTWQRVWSTLSRDTPRIDARRLTFIGHRQLITIDRQAREDDREVVLHTDEAAPARLVGVLGLDRITIEPPRSGRIDDQTLTAPREEVWFSDGESPRRPAVEEVTRRLMLGFGIDEAQAFAVLVRYARETGTRLCDVASRLDDELSDDAPAPVRVAALRRLQRIRDGLSGRR
jgi:hypothetical protein